MSYILDALRRADAERERGVVPSLQSQQHTVVEEDDAAVPRSRLLLWVIAFAFSPALMSSFPHRRACAWPAFRSAARLRGSRPREWGTVSGR